MEFPRVINCRVCKSEKLIDILSLGQQGLSDFVDLSDDTPVKSYPLDLILCPDCSLLQLRHTFPPDELYTERYGYRSGINQTMRDELQGITREVEKILLLKKGDLVVDIGCNDGTLLASYEGGPSSANESDGIIRIGYDPVPSFGFHFEKSLSIFGVENYRFFNTYFYKDPFLKEFKGKKAKIITAISMFYDLDDPNQFLEDIKACLDPEGVFVIQQNYLVGMLKQNAFDNIVHEHLEYYSLISMENLLKRHDLEVFDVIESQINGGSFRTLIKHKNSKVVSRGGKARIEKMRTAEKKLKLDQAKTYQDFGKRVTKLAKQLNQFVAKEVKKGKTIYVYGASTRGNTLLQAASLDKKLIKAAAERNSDKWGKKIASTQTPIISEDQARADQPDYFLVLPWFFKQEFLKREKQFLKAGGKMIFPLPEIYLVEYQKGKLVTTLLGK